MTPRHRPSEGSLFQLVVRANRVVACLGLGLLAAGLATANEPDGTYRGIRMLPLGSPQAWVAAGDTNADGRDDFVSLPFSGDGVVLFTSQEDGTYASTSLSETFANPLYATLGHADSDAHLDLGVGYREGAQLFHGNGDGTFRRGMLLPSIFLGRTIIMSRVNDDPHPDVLLGDEQAGAIRVFFGDGEGGFEHFRDLPTELEPHDVVADDLNGDGKLDLVIAMGSTDLIGVTLGNGDGTFQEIERISAGTNNRFLAVGDVDDDDIPDVAVSNQGSATISTLKGVGDGSLAAAIPHDTVAVPQAIEVLDLDDDGHKDLVLVGGGATGFLAIHRGHGNGTFAARETFAVGVSPIGFALGQFEGDETDDIVIANAEAAHASLLRGSVLTTFESAPRVELSGEPVAGAVAHLDADGLPDLVLAFRNVAGAVVLFGAGDGGFEAPQPLPATAFPNDVIATDLDFDGHVDVVASDLLEGVTVWRGRGERAFSEATSAMAGVLPATVTAAQLDGDGDLELIVGNAASRDVTVLFSEAGSYAAAPTPIAVGGDVSHVVTGQFTDDDTVDVVALDLTTPALRLFHNTGAGQFTDGGTIVLVGEPIDAVAGHLDNDERTDIAVVVGTETGSSTLQVFVGEDGGGVAAEPRVYATAPSATALAVTQPTADRPPHLAVTSSSLGVYVHRNDGFGDFADIIAYETAAGPVAVLAADFTGDGVKDLATVDAGGSAVTLLTAATVTGDEPQFRRGWVNGDDKLDLSDAVSILTFLFLGGAIVDCQDAVDTNDDGRLDLSDAVSLLNFLFLGGSPPPPPGSETCGVDVNEDTLPECNEGC